MSSLTGAEIRYLENILQMSSGYVLSYSDESLGQLFFRYGVSIHSDTYAAGKSKAKKLRAFWARDSDQLVGDILAEMVDVYKADCLIERRGLDPEVLGQVRRIVSRLRGPVAQAKVPESDAFLRHQYSFPELSQLPIDGALVPIIERRIREAKIALQSGAYLSVIFLSGSVLEAVLLGAAKRDLQGFNQASASPKAKTGGAKPLHEWTLSNFIDVAFELQLFELDVKKFSQSLRDFRNYIHPHAELTSGFTPDEHTAKICLQVLSAALASVVGARK